VVNDPKGEIPNTPLAVRMQVDTALNKQVADIRQFQIGFTPTARAANNSVQLSGHVDMTQSNAITGNVKLAADALDLTTYYDLFGGKKAADEKKTATQAKAEPQPRSRSKPSAELEKEPDATQLPFRNFVADVVIGRLYLREVDISSLQTTAKIDGGHVLLNPCKLGLNGAPVNANVDLDLGVPGYKYNVSFSANAVPLAPLVNTFTPERKGEVGGTLTAQANIAGAGTTGVNLQKTLAGKFDIDSTNLNLSVANVKSPIIKLIVNVVGALPELIRNPTGGALNLLEGVTGLGNGGLTDELKKSPINVIAAHGVAGSGKVDLQQAAIVSAAFRADANGTVMLAPVLSNSVVHLPVTISLSKPIAERISLSVDTNSGYAKLPDFLLITGTIGNPKADKKKLLVLATSSLKGILNAIPGTGSAGNIAGQLGGLLGGGNQSSTNAAGTNQPNKTGNLLQGALNSLLGGSGANTNTNTSTNTGATNAPTTNQSPVNSFLNDLLKPKTK
jgi:hypothetical protein